MLDFFHTPTDSGPADIQVFTGNSTTAGGSWQTWIKPRGKSMCSIWLVGKGGNGGNGAVGGNTTAAGGGGGSAGAQIHLIMPLAVLPDVLYLSLIGVTATTTLASYITTYPSIVANHTIAIANGGVNGGNATAGTAGTAGTAATASAVASMPLGWIYRTIGTPLAGAVGIVGNVGASAVYTAAALITGNTVFGGTGGAGVPAAATAGNINAGYAAVGAFPAFTYANTATAATLPGTPGPGAIMPISGLRVVYGGLGGGSSHGSATGAGLFGGNGGNGIMGSGGGGGGGCLTGGTAGVGGLGGPATAIITCW